jgi:hypothetical protein
VLIALASFAVLALGSIELFDRINGGWYRFYVFGATAGLPSVMRMAVLYVPEVVLGPLAPAMAVMAAALVLVPPTLRTRAAWFYLTGSVTLFFGFWWVHAHRGVGNTMQALYLWIALMFGIALHRLMKHFARCPAGESRPECDSAGATVVLLLAVLAQLGSQIYNPGQFLPHGRHLEARQGFEAQLRAIPGDVYVLNHSWDAVLAGKQSHAEGQAVGAVIDAGGPGREEMIAGMRRATESGEFAAIIVDGGDYATDYRQWLTPALLADFPVHVPAVGDEPRFLTSQPRQILLPCSSLTSGLAARISPYGVSPPTKECEAQGTGR